MNGIPEQKIKTALLRIDNAISEIETGAHTINESDRSSSEQREDARAILKILRHISGAIEDIRTIAANL